MRCVKHAWKISKISKNLRGCFHFGDLDMDGRIILKRILRDSRSCTGLMLLIVAISGAVIVRISYQVQYLVTLLPELLQHDSAPWSCSTTDLDI
jgi:hypothetical protein